MGKVRVATGGRAGELIDELRAQDAAVSRAQARRAELMVEFADTRKPVITGISRIGVRVARTLDSRPVSSPDWRSAWR